MDILLIILFIVAIVLMAFVLYSFRGLTTLLKDSGQENERRQSERLRESQMLQSEQQRLLAETVANSLHAGQESQKNALLQLSERLMQIQESQEGRLSKMGVAIDGSLEKLGGVLDQRMDKLGGVLDQRMDKLGGTVDQRMDKLGGTVDQRMEKLGSTVDQRMDKLGGAMDLQMDKLSERMDSRLGLMQATVDEKLHKTLEERIGQSFRLVNERLEQVYKGLGEMQTLAAGVGDLKKVLSNVKTRGVLGEYQLGAILEQILAPDQYAANVSTKKDSRESVEYAVRLPGTGEEAVWLPIDAKFPADSYNQLLDAYDTGESQAVAAAAAAMEQRIKRFAKDIRDKYIDPPNTTDFAILFLPFEGLYAEAVRRGLVEDLQVHYRVNIAGPTTLAALLNSLQMGFKTLAIQKRSSEVWQVLGAVKTEFEKFGDVLESAQKRIDQANRELDQLVGVRTRQIRRRLKDVEALPEGEGYTLLEQDEGE
ncbi:MAG: DNA recombination protein RmuC [Clostridiales bacterium]|nr:DNA recombination protein RmuC [Clostridiales bacterium]